MLRGVLPVFDESDLLLGAGAAHTGYLFPTGDCTHWIKCGYNASVFDPSLACPEFSCTRSPDFGVLSRYVAPELMRFFTTTFV